jgi:hypothetical protein
MHAKYARHRQAFGAQHTPTLTLHFYRRIMSPRSSSQHTCAAYTHACIHTQTHTRARTQPTYQNLRALVSSLDTHTNTHTHTHTHTYTHTHTHTHTYTINTAASSTKVCQPTCVASTKHSSLEKSRRATEESRVLG